MADYAELAQYLDEKRKAQQQYRNDCVAAAVTVVRKLPQFLDCDDRFIRCGVWDEPEDEHTTPKNCCRIDDDGLIVFRLALEIGDGSITEYIRVKKEAGMFRFNVGHGIDCLVNPDDDAMVKVFVSRLVQSMMQNIDKHYRNP